LEPVRVAIVGIGQRAIGFSMYIAEHSDTARVVALVDTNIEKARLLNEYYDFGAEICESCNCLAERGDIEAVMVATPDHVHIEPAMAAVKANKHLYLEKPLATTLADCDRVISAAKESRAVCYLGFNLRHSPVHAKVHELISSGAVGKLTTIEANEWYYGGRSYFRRWNRLRRFGGGLWLTKACHDFDLLNWLAAAVPVSVYASSSLSHYQPKTAAGARCRQCGIKDSCPDFFDIDNPGEQVFHELYGEMLKLMEQQGDAPDMCLFNSDKDTFDNGIVVVNYANDIRATYTVNVLAARSTRQIRIVGAEGLIEADMETGTITLTERYTETKTTFDLRKEIAGGHGGADDRILRDFFEICRHGGTPRSSLADGRLAVKLALAARNSDDKDALVTL